MNIQTGELLPVLLNISVLGSVTTSVTASNPNPGTPLYNFFNGYVDFEGAGNTDAAVQIAGTNSVLYTFSGLDPAHRYSLAGSAVRGAPCSSAAAM